MPEISSATYSARANRIRRWSILAGVVLYVGLLLWSHAAMRAHQPKGDLVDPVVEDPLRLSTGENFIMLPRMTDIGPMDDSPPMRLAYRLWVPDGLEIHTRADLMRAIQTHEPMVLIHGSPGASSNFSLLAPELTKHGFVVLAPDLPGFGHSTKRVPSYSILAHARATLRMLDALGIDRFHVLGWSQGGGVGLHLVDLAPQRTITLTMLASIGDQRAEGSGSYAFEHAKYAVGYVGLVMGGELIPHFGVLGRYEDRNAFIRNFWDTDQRPLKHIMGHLTTPTLIIHGVHDPLVPIWGARLHHQRITPSTLVVVNGSHFLPFTQPQRIASHIAAFCDWNSNPAHGPLRQDIELVGESDSLFSRVNAAMQQMQSHTPYWVVLIGFALVVAIFPEMGAAVVSVAAAFVWVDIGVAFVALALGLCTRSLWFSWQGSTQQTPCSGLRAWREEYQRRPALAAITRLQPWKRDAADAARGVLHLQHALHRNSTMPLILGCGFWAGWVLMVGYIAAGMSRLWLGDSITTLAIAFALACVAIRLALWGLTWQGRRRLLGTFVRITSHEFWPSLVLYIPLVPWLLVLGVKHRGLMTFTCANPAIEAGGGFVGESKATLAKAFAKAMPTFLPTVFIESGPIEQRLEYLRSAMDSQKISKAYPVILKPDAGQRGYAVKLAKNEDEARQYLVAMPRPVVAQSFHPGPHEIGVMWVRHRNTADPSCDDQDAQHEPGFIFSITIKDFAYVVGDGTHTIEQLVYRHGRYRAQADTFLIRLADDRLRIPDAGEQVKLNESGNHAQGTLFRDGSELLTPQLHTFINHIIESFTTDHPSPAWHDNGLDFGRFDLRYAQEDDLTTCTHLGIVEFNGTSAESTNLYDPGRSIIWAYRILFAQWRMLYALGSRRRAQGVTPMSPFDLYKAWRAFNTDLPDMHVAD